MLCDPSVAMETKRRAVRILRYLPTQDTANILMKAISEISDHSYRFVMLKCMNGIAKKNPSLEIPRRAILKEIEREVRIFEKIRKIQSGYQRQTREKSSSEDYMDVVLHAMRDENGERIFRFLKLLYPGGMMQMIYEGMADRSQSDSARAHAVELLLNTAEHDILRILKPVLEDCEKRPVTENDFIEIVGEFLESEDPWFVITAQFLVTEMHLAERWPERFGTGFELLPFLEKK